MGYFYFDESIHDRAGFIVGAFVYSETDITQKIFDAISSVGLQPGIDEFKSSSKMSQNIPQRELRNRMADLLRHNAKLGLVVVPISDRADLGAAAVDCLTKILSANSLLHTQHEVNFDEGIVIPTSATALLRNCTVKSGCDSKKVPGIQIADFAAHYLSGMLKDHMTVDAQKKIIVVGEDWGYEEGTEMNIGFELWVALRDTFFRAPVTLSQQASYDQEVMATFDVANYGLHISATCGAKLQKAAAERFGTTYVGCIH